MNIECGCYTGQRGADAQSKLRRPHSTCPPLFSLLLRSATIVPNPCPFSRRDRYPVLQQRASLPSPESGFHPQPLRGFLQPTTPAVGRTPLRSPIPTHGEGEKRHRDHRETG